MSRKRDLTVELFKMSKLNFNIHWQKSRSRWLKEGDANTRYYHGCENKRRKENEFVSLDVNERKLVEAEEIKR